MNYTCWYWLHCWVERGVGVRRKKKKSKNSLHSFQIMLLGRRRLWLLWMGNIFCTVIMCVQHCRKDSRLGEYGKFMSFELFSVAEVIWHSHNISTRTVRSAAGTSLVFDAWHTYVLLSASRFTCWISSRLTVTWRPIDTPPPVWIGVVPLNHVTVGSGRPVGEKIILGFEFLVQIEIWKWNENIFRGERERKLKIKWNSAFQSGKILLRHVALRRQSLT